MVQKDDHLLELSRYIVLNPVRARMVRTARDWPWSNYRVTVGMTVVPNWLEIDWILAAFAERKQQAQTAYRRFVADGKNRPFPWQELKNQIYLDSDAFVDTMQRKIDADRRLSEIPKTQRRPVSRPLTWYFDKHRDRDTAIFEALNSGGYNMREISEHGGLPYSRIGRIVNLPEKARDKT
ncbi:MAG: addiction module toxin RelE [Gammaproteobacteria bacterium]|nr:addiction module toxin RelE [Gammaproteobacteria bacterium]